MGEQQEENEVRELLEDESGVAYVEYIILLSLVTVLGSVAVFSVGLPFFTTYRFTQLLVALPFP
jgi:Flp pilus assembly pilin Flp